jgi:hypothetical protein
VRTMMRLRTESMCLTTLVVMRLRMPERRLLLGVGTPPSPLSFPEPAAGGVLTLVEGEADRELKSSSRENPTFWSSAGHRGTHSQWRACGARGCGSTGGAGGTAVLSPSPKATT